MEPRLWGWLVLDDNEVYVRYPMLYEPYYLMEKERLGLFEVGKSLMLAYLDEITENASHQDHEVLPSPASDSSYQISKPEYARRITENNE